MLADLPPLFGLQYFGYACVGPLLLAHRLEGSIARGAAARQPAASLRACAGGVVMARAHLIGSELKATKLEEFSNSETRKH